VSDKRPDAVPWTASGHHLGAIVRGARTAQRMTLAELGGRTGYSAAQVSRYERGIAPLTDIDVIIRFARALGIPPGDLGLAPVAVRFGEKILPSTPPASRSCSPGSTRRGPEPSLGLLNRHGVAETVRPYTDRGLVTRQQWNAIISRARSELWLYGMAEYGYATDDDVPGILASVTSRGCRVRVLLLSPDSPGTRSIDRDEGHPSGTIAARTRAALARFTQMRLTCGSRMQIRVYNEYPTVSVVRGDDTMLVTPYLRFFIGSNSPTFEIRTADAPKMFTRYVRHFENTWHLAEDWTR
jgi:transcriptional regulator with XRE-family HTH domain